ncbi:MAG TPA: hypothetical protein VH500_06855 [Nitrososphaeraceae archaeon]|jgi:hypothetical protein
MNDFYMTLDDSLYVEPILNKRAVKHYSNSALLSAIHILICLTKGKSPEEIAKDFDGNIELVCVWIDYMVGINWVYRNANDGTWVASDNGKEWIEKYYKMLYN